jgi:hypothetical protein
MRVGSHLSAQSRSSPAPTLSRQWVGASAFNWHAGSWVIAIATILLSGRWRAFFVFAILFGVSQSVSIALRGNPRDVLAARRVQAISLFVTMVAMLATSLLFYANLGSTLGENDEAKIHFWALESAEDLRFGSGLSWIGDWPGHSVPLILLYAATTPFSLGAQEPHDFVFLEKLYTVFWASWIPVVVYYALRRRFDVAASVKAAIAVAMFPAMLHFGSLAVRDALVTFNYTYFFYLLSSRTKSAWNVAMRFVLLLYTYAIRPESGAFLGVAWIGYEIVMGLHYAMRNHKGCFMPVLTGMVVLVLGLTFVSIPKLITDLAMLHDTYLEFSADGASSSSLGMRIRTLPQPLPPLVLGAVGATGMIPPTTQISSPFIESQTIDELIATRAKWSWSPGRILKAAAPVAWQMCLPFMCIGFLRRDQLLREYPEFLPIVIVSFGYMCVIPQFTIDLGKLSAGYPFPLALAFIAYQSSSPRERRRAFLVLACWLAALAAVYFHLKSR